MKTKEETTRVHTFGGVPSHKIYAHTGKFPRSRWNAYFTPFAFGIFSAAFGVIGGIASLICLGHIDGAIPLVSILSISAALIVGGKK